MKKFIIKSIIFIAISILVLVVVLNPMFKDLDRSKFDKTYLDFTKASKDSVDIMIFGSSHAMNSYNPEIIDSLLGTYSFNFGLSSQRLKTTDFLINEVISDHKPKVVVLDLFQYALDETSTLNAKNYQLKVLSTLPNSRIKFQHLWNNYSLNDMLSVAIPTYRNHNLWYDIKFNDMLKPYDTDEFSFTKRGFYYLNGNLKNKDKKKIKKIDLNNYEVYPVKYSLQFLNKEQRNSIVKTIEDLKAKDINVIVITAPYLDYFLKSSHPEFNASIKFIADSLKVPYIDFNSQFGEMNLNANNYRDKGHLNKSGADIVSINLAKIIAANSTYSIVESKDTNDNLGKDIDEKLITKIIFEGTKTLVNHSFLPNVNSNELITANIDNENFVAIKLSKSISVDFFDDKAFAIHTILLNKDIKKAKLKKKNRIISKSFVSTHTIDDDQYLILKYANKTGIRNFKSLRLFIMDKEKFNGVIGETLVINNVNF